mgnify:CR=1 FL=1
MNLLLGNDTSCRSLGIDTRPEMLLLKSSTCRNMDSNTFA